MSTTYFLGSGELFVGARTAAGLNQGFLSIGNAPKIELSGEATFITHKESITGENLTDLKLPKDKMLKLQADFENFSKENLALAFYGAVNAITGTTATAEAFTPAPADYTLVAADLGKQFKLLHSGISSVTIKDSAGSPATLPSTKGVSSITLTAGGTGYTTGSLVFTGGGGSGAAGTFIAAGGIVTSVTLTAYGSGYTSAPVVSAASGSGLAVTVAIGTYYDLDLVAGAVTMNLIGTGPSAGYTQPFTADYTYANATQIGFMTEDIVEKCILFRGINTAVTPAKYTVIELYRVQFEPSKNFNFIDDNLGKFSFSGEALQDTTKAASAALGQFGYIEQPS